MRVPVPAGRMAEGRVVPAHYFDPMTIIPGPYLDDIRAQPDVLRVGCAALSTRAPLPDFAAALRDGRFRRVVLTGMGSSFHALYPLHLRLIDAGVVSHWVETSELLIGYGPLKSRDTLLVAVSQSGESAEIVSLVRQSGDVGHLIGVTNQPSSTLGAAANTLFPLHAGKEATVSCKTYVATLAVLHWLGAALVGGDGSVAVEQLGRIEAPMRAYLAGLHGHVAAMGERLAEIRATFVTGRGVSLATAGTGGLILKESTRQPAEGMSGAAFRHGPFEMLGPHIFVLVLAGEPAVVPLHRRLVADIARHGGVARLVAAQDDLAGEFRLPSVPGMLLPLVEILPVQMLSLALAARDGREAGRFEHASKVTRIE